MAKEDILNTLADAVLDGDDEESPGIQVIRHHAMAFKHVHLVHHEDEPASVWHGISSVH